MAATKAKRPALRYLLSADPRLRKLSLKKLAQRVQKTKAPKRSARTRKPASPAGVSMRGLRSASPRAIGLAGVGVLAAASLFAAGQISDRPHGADAVVTPVVEARLVGGPSPEAPAREERPVSSVKPRPSAPATRTVVKPPASAPASSAFEPEPPGSVTITGCLVQNSAGFSLKDVSGDAVPKTRSWRSGFFKKGSPRLDVVAAAATVKLASHDGERVSMTGVLVGRELRARSVRRIAPQCN